MHQIEKFHYQNPKNSIPSASQFSRLWRWELAAYFSIVERLIWADCKRMFLCPALRSQLRSRSATRSRSTHTGLCLVEKLVFFFWKMKRLKGRHNEVMKTRSWNNWTGEVVPFTGIIEEQTLRMQKQSFRMSKAGTYAKTNNNTIIILSKLTFHEIKESAHL